MLTEKRRAGDRPFDVRPLPSATLADLDRVRFENDYLPSAFAPDVLQANDRTIEQRLAVTKMIDGADTAVPTELGVLVLGRSTRDFLPGAYIQFLRIAGRDLADPVVDELAVACNPCSVFAALNAWARGAAARRWSAPRRWRSPSRRKPPSRSARWRRARARWRRPRLRRRGYRLPSWTIDGSPEAIAAPWTACTPTPQPPALTSARRDVRRGRFADDGERSSISPPRSGIHRSGFAAFAALQLQLDG